MKDQYARSVFCSLQFSAIHCWPDAQIPVGFLAGPHRHLFKISCRAPVSHNDRDIEFITMKENVERFCREQWDGRDIGSISCEMIAETILEAFEELDSVTVSEDGENGATLTRM